MNTAVKERPPTEVAALRLTVDRAILLKALGHASAIVEKRNTIPVLSNVLLEAADGGLRLVSTDLNMQIALGVPANIEGDGATTVSAALLHSIVRELPDGCPIQLRVDDGRLHVIGGRSRYKLQIIPDDQFPRLKEKDAVCEFTLAASDLQRAFASVAFAQDTDAVARPYCCGVNLEAHGGELTLVAMDGKRAAWASRAVAADVEMTGAILSTKLVATLAKLLDGHDGDVRLAFDSGKVALSVGDAVLTGKLVEGTFPPWRRIVPDGPGKRLLIGADALEAAVRRAALVANERARAVKIELTTDKATISCTSPEFGTAVEEAPCVWDEGEFVRGFNARFLLDTLAASRADELQIDFQDGPLGLALFTNPNDASARWLLAPMHV